MNKLYFVVFTLSNGVTKWVCDSAFLTQEGAKKGAKKVKEKFPMSLTHSSFIIYEGLAIISSDKNQISLGGDSDKSFTSQWQDNSFQN